MKLFINDTPIGFSPNETDTIQHLLTAVLKELEENLIIAAMIVNNEYKSIDDPEVLVIPISSINKIELTVATRKEIGISLIEDGKQFLIIGAQELKNGSLAKKTELINSFAWILESLEALRNSLAFPPTDIPILRAMLKNILTTLEDTVPNLEQMKELGEELDKLADHFETLKQKLTNVEEFSKESTYANLRETQTLLSELATNFQIGNDLKAIQNLCKVIDTIDMFTRYTATYPNNDRLEQHALELRDISMQLLNAFENKDFVLIADLIEYDLNDSIDNILEGEF